MENDKPNTCFIRTMTWLHMIIYGWLLILILMPLIALTPILDGLTFFVSDASFGGIAVQEIFTLDRSLPLFIWFSLEFIWGLILLGAIKKEDGSTFRECLEYRAFGLVGFNIVLIDAFVKGERDLTLLFGFLVILNFTFGLILLQFKRRYIGRDRRFSKFGSSGHSDKIFFVMEV